MLRLVLALLLLGVAGAIGYFYGRQAQSPPTPIANTPQGTEAAKPAAPQQTSRSRTAEMGAVGPNVSPTAPIEHPLGVPVVPPEPAKAEARADQPGVTPEGSMPGRYSIGLPIQDLEAKDIHDTFHDARGGGERRHEATDIMAPRGTPVVASVNGIVKKLFTSDAGGLTVYQFDPAEQYCFYYAHLDRYAPELREGLLLRKGDLVGYVGSTGNAVDPHLHFAILELGPEKKWWEDTKPVNPYPFLMRSIQTKRRR